MNGRDITLLATGAALGLGLGAGIARLPVWNGDASVVAPPPARSERPAEPSATRDADDPEAPPPAVRTAPSAVRAATRERGTPTFDGPMLYREDGPIPCGEDCVERLTTALLSGRLSPQDFDDASGVLDAIGRRIGGDPALQRRYLSALSSLRAEDGGERPALMLFAMVLHAGGLPDDFVERAGQRLASSPQPELRSMALDLASRRGEGPQARRAVERALTQETDPLVLSHALNLVSRLGSDPQPGLLSSIRRMAVDHDDPRVRQAAMNAYAWREDADPVDTRRLMERALRDPAPLVRVQAVSLVIGRMQDRPPDDELERYRAVLTEIADDPAADAEARMQALSTLTYVLDAGDEVPWGRMYDHY